MFLHDIACSTAIDHDKQTGFCTFSYVITYYGNSMTSILLVVRSIYWSPITILTVVLYTMSCLAN